MVQFNNELVQKLFFELKELKADGAEYEAQKEKFDVIKKTVETQDGYVQGNYENGVQGGEYKSSDADGDLVTCSIIGDKISYQRTSRIEDKEGTDDGVLKFTLIDTGSEIQIEGGLVGDAN